MAATTMESMAELWPSFFCLFAIFFDDEWSEPPNCAHTSYPMICDMLRQFSC